MRSASEAAMTLVEVLVVAAILGLVASIAVGSHFGRNAGDGARGAIQRWEWRIRDEARRLGGLRIRLEADGPGPLSAPQGAAWSDTHGRALDEIAVDGRGMCEDRLVTSGRETWLIDGYSGNLSPDAGPAQ